MNPPVSRPPLIRGDAWDFAAAVRLHQVALTNHRRQVCHKVAIPSESFSGKNLSGKKRAESVGPADLRGIGDVTRYLRDIRCSPVDDLI